MESSNDDAKKGGPPPPDIKSGPPAPPVPSIVDAGAKEAAEKPAPKSAGLNVKIKEDDGEQERGGEESELDPRAGLGARVGGFLIDLLVCMGSSVVLSAVLPFDFLDHLATLVAVAYLLTRDSLPFLKGQSLGKKVLGIRVETLDGEGLAENWQAGALRNVALIIPPFWVVELIVLLSREDKERSGTRLGDEWAKTRVVKVEPPETDE